MNYTDRQWNIVLESQEAGRKPKCNYVAIAREEAPTTGTKHFHALVFFKDAQFPAAIRNKFRGMNIEPCKPKATFKTQWEYISKFSEPEERGIRPQDNGWKAGNDANKEAWERTRALAIEGRLEEIEACHYITQYGNLKRIAKDNMPKPEALPIPARKVFFEWWYGPPGAGKSMEAMKVLIEEFGEEYVYDKPPQVKWIGEDCKPTAAWRINDLDKFQSKHLGGLLKTWAEESPFQGEVKNSLQWFRPAKIIVTSNPPPWEIWEDNHTIDAILDRFKVVYWPNTYVPGMEKPDRRIDEIHPPWRYRAPEEEMTIPRPVLSRTDSISFANVGSSIWSSPLRPPISADLNRSEIRDWIQEFNHDAANNLLEPVSYAYGFNPPSILEERAEEDCLDQDILDILNAK